MTGRDQLRARLMLPQQRRRPGRLQEAVVFAANAPAIVARARVDRDEVRLLLAVLLQEHASAADDRRAGGAEVQVDRCRLPLPLPQRLTVERETEQPDVLPERHVQALAVGGRRLRRVRVLAMASARRQPLVRLALPDDRAGPRVERVDHVANDVGLFRPFVVARPHTTHHLVVGQALLAQLRDVVVAIQARRGLLERLAADGGGDIDAAVPDDRRRPSAPRHVHRPADVLGRRPAHRQSGLLRQPVARRPSERRPAAGRGGGRSEQSGEREAQVQSRAHGSSIHQPRSARPSDWRYGRDDGYAVALRGECHFHACSTMVLRSGVARRPAEHVAGASGIGHQLRRIARAPRRQVEGHVPSTHLADRVDYLAHGVPDTGAQIDRLARRARAEALDRAQVRVGEIDDVDVVANRPCRPAVG